MTFDIVGLTAAKIKKISENESCKIEGFPHDRVMWAAGFRKGLKQVKRRILMRQEEGAYINPSSLEKAHLRRNKTGKTQKDLMWAKGFEAGVAYTKNTKKYKKLF